jgi:hypothetical protein
MTRLAVTAWRQDARVADAYRAAVEKAWSVSQQPGGAPTMDEEEADAWAQRLSKVRA